MHLVSSVSNNKSLSAGWRALVIRVCGAYYILSKVRKVTSEGHKYSNFEKHMLDNKEQIPCKSVSFETHSSYHQ